MTLGNWMIKKCLKWNNIVLVLIECTKLEPCAFFPLMSYTVTLTSI